jgi:hypothetical protein
MIMRKKLIELLAAVHDGSIYIDDAVDEIMSLVPSKVIAGPVGDNRYSVLIKTNIEKTSNITWVVQSSNGAYIQIDGICERLSALELLKENTDKG